MKREWSGFILGAWILVSPWVLGFAGVDFLKWSNTVCGLALMVVNGWHIFGKTE